MGTRKRFTDEEDQVIISKIKENPNNLLETFRKAAAEINRDWRVIKQHWYIKNKHQAAFGMIFCKSFIKLNNIDGNKNFSNSYK